MGKNSKDTIYAVYKNGVLMESRSWCPANGWCVVHKSGQVFPLAAFKIEVKDDNHYIIEGAEYNKDDFYICTQDEAAGILNNRTVLKSDDDGNKIMSPDDEVFKDIIKDMPIVNDGNFRPFTKAVINAIKQNGKIISVPKKLHSKRLGIIRAMRDKHMSGNSDITIDDAIFILGTFNLQITDVLNEKYI